MSDSVEITGTFRNGHVELDSSGGLPEGTRVRVVPESDVTPKHEENDHAHDELWGIDAADYQDTPEFRAKLISQIDSFEPLELTPEEEAEWEAARKWRKEYSLAAVRKQMGLEP